MHGAGAALRDAASVLGTGEAKVVADDPQQRSVRITVEFATRAVDIERDGHAKLLVQERMPGGGIGYQGAGQAAPDSIHAAINAPSCAWVPGAGSRFPPGIQPQPTS